MLKEKYSNNKLNIPRVLSGHGNFWLEKKIPGPNFLIKIVTN